MNVVYGAEGWRDEVAQAVLKYGIVVVEGVFADNECTGIVDRIVTGVEQLGSGVDRADISTWNRRNLPSRVRAGMMQAVMSNHPAVWDVRCDERVHDVFQAGYDFTYNSAEYGPVGPLITSIDGINLKPRGQAPFHDPAAEDWAHLDQTDMAWPFKCLQGQVVLTNTTACFRASPSSHRVFGLVLRECGIADGDKSNWCMIKEHTDAVRKIVRDGGGQYQVPIRAPKGSVILWLSSIIHSAQFAEKPADDGGANDDADALRQIDDPFYDWRAVIYVCMRPAREFYGKDGKLSDAFIKRRKTIVDGNRTTNHWGDTMFPKLLGGRHANKLVYHEAIAELHRDPSLAYARWGIESPWTREDVQRLNGALNLRC